MSTVADLARARGLHPNTVRRRVRVYGWTLERALAEPAARRGRGRTLTERFWATVDATGPCWAWCGSLDSHGYGRFRVVPTVGQTVAAHRWSYEHLVGPIPDGLVMDHLCRVRNCVNPDHLEPVTQAENNRRGVMLVRRAIARRAAS